MAEVYNPRVRRSRGRRAAQKAVRSRCIGVGSPHSCRVRFLGRRLKLTRFRAQVDQEQRVALVSIVSSGVDHVKGRISLAGRRRYSACRRRGVRIPLAEPTRTYQVRALQRRDWFSGTTSTCHAAHHRPCSRLCRLRVCAHGRNAGQGGCRRMHEAIAALVIWGPRLGPDEQPLMPPLRPYPSRDGRCDKERSPLDSEINVDLDPGRTSPVGWR